jgi:hypothetical protein
MKQQPQPQQPQPHKHNDDHHHRDFHSAGDAGHHAGAAQGSGLVNRRLQWWHYATVVCYARLVLIEFVATYFCALFTVGAAVAAAMVRHNLTEVHLLLLQRCR